MTHHPPPQPPFRTFGDLFAGDPYALAAAGLDLFQQPKIPQGRLQSWLRGLVAEKGQTFLGVSISEPPPLEATEHRIILIWEHSLVVARTVDGGDVVRAGLLLLDPRVLRWAHDQRRAHLRGGLGATDLR
ncbi:hypothetical protein ACQBAU_03410 [Propionibacteriaceae bacterium Y2011]|uniref:hypothetical protein n=1 Tax=Microlunatus sp. Y2014 TaxID=3418488 RepID=UPI003B4C2CE3